LNIARKRHCLQELKAEREKAMITPERGDRWRVSGDQQGGVMWAQRVVLSREFCKCPCSNEERARIRNDYLAEAVVYNHDSKIRRGIERRGLSWRS